MLNKIREWSFPVSVLVAWLVVTGYTVSALTQLPFGRVRPATSTEAQVAQQRPNV